MYTYSIVTCFHVYKLLVAMLNALADVKELNLAHLVREMQWIFHPATHKGDNGLDDSSAVHHQSVPFLRSVTEVKMAVNTAAPARTKNIRIRIIFFQVQT